MHQPSYKIMIFGCPGSGKSTFALKLSKQLNIPLHHLDYYFFTANWVERNYQDFLGIQQTLVNNKSWIIDGNATRSLEMRFAQADIVLYFNLPKLTCYIRVFQRFFYKNHEIKDRPQGCNERIGLKLIRYMWNFETRVKYIIKILREKYPDVLFTEICSDNDLIIIERNLSNQVQGGYKR